MSTTSITERITVTHEPGGGIVVEAEAPLPLGDAYPGETYDATVFNGWWTGTAWTYASWRTGRRGENYELLPKVDITNPEDAQAYLVGIATLVLAANGVTA